MRNLYGNLFDRLTLEEQNEAAFLNNMFGKYSIFPRINVSGIFDKIERIRHASYFTMKKLYDFQLFIYSFNTLIITGMSFYNCSPIN